MDAILNTSKICMALASDFHEYGQTAKLKYFSSTPPAQQNQEFALEPNVCFYYYRCQTTGEYLTQTNLEAGTSYD